MKNHSLEFSLVNATPKEMSIDTLFTERVMTSLQNTNMLSPHIHNERKQTVWYRFRHLPKFTMVLLALVTLFIASTVTYAVVETIKQTNNVKIEKSGVNEFGREQLSVAFDSCAEEKDAGTTYELKKDSGLSAEDGAKVLQARCDLDFISSWIQKDPVFASKKDMYFLSPELASQGVAGTLKNISPTNILLHTPKSFMGEETDQTFPLPTGARFVDGNKEIARSNLKPGDTLLYFSPRVDSRDQSLDSPNETVVFKLSLPPKYYGLEMRSYVRARSACDNNPVRTCVHNNSINTVILLVSHGGAWIDPGINITMKSVQGKVVSWDNTSIKIDVGDGIIYTLNTPSNIVDIYNTSTVYGLKSFDTIYAKTDPEILKIRKGDSLEITYKEDTDQSSPTVEWSQNLSIALMVERRVDNIDVLRKY